MKAFYLFLTVCFLSAKDIYAQKFENLALTPPMGWNSWNAFECEGVNETVIREMADAMVEKGLKRCGLRVYRY